MWDTVLAPGSHHFWLTRNAQLMTRSHDIQTLCHFDFWLKYLQHLVVVFYFVYFHLECLVFVFNCLLFFSQMLAKKNDITLIYLLHISLSKIISSTDGYCYAKQHTLILCHHNDGLENPLMKYYGVTWVIVFCRWLQWCLQYHWSITPTIIMITFIITSHVATHILASLTLNTSLARDCSMVCAFLKIIAIFFW